MLTAFHKGGTSRYNAIDKYNATYASTIVQQMGIGEFSPTDLSKFLAGKTANVSTTIIRSVSKCNRQQQRKRF